MPLLQLLLAEEVVALHVDDLISIPGEPVPADVLGRVGEDDVPAHAAPRPGVELVALDVVLRVLVDPPLPAQPLGIVPDQRYAAVGAFRRAGDKVA